MLNKAKVGWIIGIAIFVPISKHSIFLYHEAQRQAAARAVERGDVRELSRMLDKGVSPNSYVRLEDKPESFWIIRQSFQHQDNRTQGKSLIWRAAWAKNAAAVDLLLAKGAYVDASDEGGATPLNIAVHQDDLRMVRTLLAHGADPWAATKGDGPMRSNDKQIDKLLEDARAAWPIPQDRRKNTPHCIWPKGDNL